MLYIPYELGNKSIAKPNQRYSKASVMVYILQEIGNKSIAKPSHRYSKASVMLYILQEVGNKSVAKPNHRYSQFKVMLYVPLEIKLQINQTNTASKYYAIYALENKAIAKKTNTIYVS